MGRVSVSPYYIEESKLTGGLRTISTLSKKKKRMNVQLIESMLQASRQSGLGQNILSRRQNKTSPHLKLKTDRSKIKMTSSVLTGLRRAVEATEERCLLNCTVPLRSCHFPGNVGTAHRLSLGLLGLAQQEHKRDLSILVLPLMRSGLAQSIPQRGSYTTSLTTKI